MRLSVFVAGLCFAYILVLSTGCWVNRCSDVAAAVTDTDLANIANKLWGLDENALSIPDEIELNTGAKLRSCGRQSPSALPKRMYKTIDLEAALSISTYKKMRDLFGIYNPDLGHKEVYTPRQVAQMVDFIREMMKTTVMKGAWNFLKSKGLSSASSASFQAQIYKIWFTLYSRGFGIPNTCGFEHVFVGEIKKSKVSGLHNWLRMYLQINEGKLKYYGYCSYREPRRLKTSFLWNNYPKDLGSLLMGSSPELEFALYTICFLSRPNAVCKMKVNNKKLYFQTFTINYRGQSLVGSAYPL